MYWVGGDGRIYVAWNVLGQGWNVYQLPGDYPPPAQQASINCISRTTVKVDIYWAGSDGRIYAAWNILGQGWNVYQVRGNYPSPAQETNINCISRTTDQIDIYWAGSDGRVYAAWNALRQTWDDHVYQIPGGYPPPSPGASINCISRTAGKIDIYWAGSDGRVYAAWNVLGQTWDNHVYQIPGNYPLPAPGASINCISRTPDQVDIYWIGSDGKIYAAWNVLGQTWDNHVYQVPGEYTMRI